MFWHRPAQENSISAEEIALKRGLFYKKCASDKDIDNSCDVYLITGAGIISPECIKGKKIVNCHPGIIPAVRGLDAFKWAILDKKPLGVTLHYIDKEIDEGQIIAVLPTPIYKTDSLLSLAARHYETEIRATANFLRYIKNPTNPYAAIEKGEPRMRMPLAKEKELLRSFDAYLEKFA
ncbi:MAG: formyltransferase family protein [Helicobacteraceae bacterium]